MKKILIFIFIGMILIPNIGIADATLNQSSLKLACMGAVPSYIMEYKDLDKNMTRKELATVVVRLQDLEYLIHSNNRDSLFKDVKGWAIPYVNIAYKSGIMKGTGEDKFKPDANITYIELLTVIMRSLGYKDGIDFKKYPEDYYTKALEIGLANMYITYNQVITREIAYDTINKVYDMDYEDIPIQAPEDYEIKEGIPGAEGSPIDEVTVKNLYFNTSIIGVFSGELVGLRDFSGYKIELLSQEDKLYKTKTLDKSGKFHITDFDTSLISKLTGYKYRLYNNKGRLILEENL